MLSVAIVGLGAVSKVHLQAVEKSQTSKLSMVCDVDLDKAKQVASEYDVPYTDDYQSLVNDTQIDCVHILTPHDLHFSMAMLALEFGKHVILEKPAVLSIEESQLLAKKAQKSGSNITVCFQNRFNNVSLYLKDIVETQSYGLPLSAKCDVTWSRQLSYYNLSDWKGSVEREGGGTLISQAIHTLDLLLWLFGDVEYYTGSLFNLDHNYIECEDTVNLAIKHASGCNTFLFATNSFGYDASVSMEVKFENAVLRMADDKLFIKHENKTMLLCENEISETFKKYWGVSHAKLIDDFYISCVSDAAQYISLDSALKTNNMVLDFYKRFRDN